MSDPATTIQEIYAAFGRGDLDAVLNRVAPETDWCWAIPEAVPGGKAVPFMRNLRTREEVGETYFGSVASQLEMHGFLPKQFFVDGNDVAVVLEIEYTVKSSGRRLQLDEMHHFTVVDGQVVRYRPYLDTASLVEAFAG